jgi:hypothetical protein
LFKLIRYLRGKDTAQMVYFKTYAEVKKALPVVREGLWGIHNVSSLIPFREGGFNPVLQVDAFNRGEVSEKTKTGGSEATESPKRGYYI